MYIKSSCRFYREPWRYVEVGPKNTAREAIQNIIDRGLHARLRTTAVIDIEHASVRALLHSFFKTGVMYRLDEGTLATFRTNGWISADLEKKVDFPIKLRLFLTRSARVLDESGNILKQRYVQRMSLSFTKSCINHR